MAKFIEAWLQAKVQWDETMKVDAFAKAHGEPVAMISADCTSLVVQFKQQYGNDIPDEKLPAQS